MELNHRLEHADTVSLGDDDLAQLIISIVEDGLKQCGLVGEVVCNTSFSHADICGDLGDGASSVPGCGEDVESLVKNCLPRLVSFCIFAARCSFFGRGRLTGHRDFLSMGALLP